MKALLKQSEKAVDLLSSEDIERILSGKQLAVWHYLNRVGEAPPGETARETGVARPTVNQAVLKLLKLEKIERLGLGRSTRYRVLKRGMD